MYFFRKRKDPNRERLEQAVARYPIYRPPHPQPFPRNSISIAQENYAYFLSHKVAHVGYFAELIKTFGATATIDRNGISQVDVWLHKFGGYLAGNERTEEREALSYFEPVWDGEFRRINVIWDLSIYVGDVICALNQNASWGLDTGDEHPVSRQVAGYFKPCVFLNDRKRPLLRLNISEDMLFLVRAKKEFNKRGIERPGFGGYMKPDGLQRYLANFM